MILYVNRHEVIKTVFKYFNDVLHENFEGCGNAIRELETFKGGEIIKLLDVEGDKK